MQVLRHGRTPQQKRARERVERVLAGAALEFAENGFAQTTTNRIAKRAGVHVPSLYQY
ncbi:MAG: TetR/AcrR family transcriptional regulator, partial [Deltaproteobacteria bacterium]|nr:TetR/AcrR family transcriptional regulator [Deltaproteobacteria bacterium]